MARIYNAMLELNRLNITHAQLLKEIRETNGKLHELREKEQILANQIIFFHDNNIKEITRDGEVIPMPEGDEI